MPWITLVTLLALVLLSLPSAFASAAVIVTPWGPPDIQPFAPGSPPTSPPLPPGADADAAPWLSITGGTVDGSWSPGDSTYTVTSIGDITVSGHSQLRWPTNADSALRAHEVGHDSLNHYEYDRNAQRKVEDAMRGFIGMKFKGEGATDAEREASAKSKARAEKNRRLKAARAALDQQMGVLSDAYDGITEHGTSPTVDTLEGIRRAIEERSRAPHAGLVPRSHDPAKPFCAANGGSQAVYDEEESRLPIVGPGLITEARFPMDPILGRGWIQVDTFVVIGAQENGTVLLSDTWIRIVDSATGDTLLNGALVEVAYLPSSVPGFPGMIQAYLVIPPPWVPGIMNTIGSPFLAELEAADLAGEMTTAWLYSPLPIFDPLGRCLMPPEGVPLAPTLGVAGPVSGVPGSPAAQPPGLSVWPRPARDAVRFAWKPVAAPLELEVYDLSGARRWATRADGSLGRWDWPGRDADGRALHAGVYFARLHGGGLDLRARVVLVR